MPNDVNTGNVHKMHVYLIEDKRVGGFTAFSPEYPEAVAEGEDIAQAIEYLGKCLAVMFEDQKTRENGKEEVDCKG